jgi:hypothetical protein
MALVGYFDDLTSHGLNLFHYLLGKFENAQGHHANQKQLYMANDAISASWIHQNKIIGYAFWNFGS